MKNILLTLSLLVFLVALCAYSLFRNSNPLYYSTTCLYPEQQGGTFICTEHMLTL